MELIRRKISALSYLLWMSCVCISPWIFLCCFCACPAATNKTPKKLNDIQKDFILFNRVGQFSRRHWYYCRNPFILNPTKSFYSILMLKLVQSCVSAIVFQFVFNEILNIFHMHWKYHSNSMLEMFMIFSTIMNWCGLVEATKLMGMTMEYDDVSIKTKSDLKTTLTL